MYINVVFCFTLGDDDSIENNNFKDNIMMILIRLDLNVRENVSTYAGNNNNNTSK